MGKGVLLVAALVLISGCGSGPTPKTEPEQQIERDKGPVLERFPQLGDITGVEWVTKDLGKPSDMPGPTDFRVSGVAQLSRPDAKRLRQENDWVRTETPPNTLEGISSQVPRNVEWQVSEEFTSGVTGGAYEASFFLDPVAGVMVFDAVNPSVASP